MNPLFQSIFSTGVVTTPDGHHLPFHSNVSPGVCEALLEEVSRLKRPSVLEIGMAFGTSSVHLADGIRNAGGGTLASIDPNQTVEYGRLGVHHMEVSGHAEVFSLIEEPSAVALPRLLATGSRFDFVFIDGWHSFDSAFVDFYYSDLMLNVGGLLAFHDAGMPAVAQVIRFMESHKCYELRRNVPYAFSRKGKLAMQMKRWRAAARHILRRPGAASAPPAFPDECRIYRKMSHSQVAWDYYRAF
jgi:predicted O-methyltransferase YrrM